MNNLLEHNISTESLDVPNRNSEEEKLPLNGHRAKHHSGKYRPALLVNTLKISDFAAVLIAGFAGYFFRFGFSSPLSSASHLFIYFSTILTVVSLHMAHGYRIGALTSLGMQISTLFVGGAGALFVILTCGYLSGTLHDYSRIWLLSSVATAATLLLLNRIGMTRLVCHAVKNKKLMESVVIVGANEHAEKMIATILGTPNSSINILGVFDDRSERPLSPSLRLQLLGSTDKLLSFIRCNHVDRVVVALPWVATRRTNELLTKLRTVPVRLDLVPNDVVWQFKAINMERMGDVPVLTIANAKIEAQSGVIKRIEDLVISTSMLILAAPFMLLIALAIKLDSKGPALFKQRRHGFNNQIFEVYKFRSMTATDSLNHEITQATRDDPRVTRVGKFLRRSSLDELPQLFNVLMGQMSVVGPRPHAVQHNIAYGLIISEYFARHNVKPGITGWAQVNGLRGETSTPEKMHKRVNADLYYIERWSLLLDLKIILMTAITVWSEEAAY